MLACRLPPCFMRLYFHSPCTEARFGSKLSKQPKQPQGAPTCPANCTSLGLLPAPLMAPPPVMRQPTCWGVRHMHVPSSSATHDCPLGHSPLHMGALSSHGVSQTQPPPAVGAQTWLASGQVPLQPEAPLFSHGTWQTQPPPAVGAQTWLASGQVPLQAEAPLFSHGTWQTQPPPAVGAQTWLASGQVPLQAEAPLFSHGTWQT